MREDFQISHRRLVTEACKNEENSHSSIEYGADSTASFIARVLLSSARNDVSRFSTVFSHVKARIFSGCAKRIQNCL
jgi:hypothetical protein